MKASFPLKQYVGNNLSRFIVALVSAVKLFGRVEYVLLAHQVPQQPVRG